MRIVYPQGRGLEDHPLSILWIQKAVCMIMSSASRQLKKKKATTGAAQEQHAGAPCIYMPTTVSNCS